MLNGAISKFKLKTPKKTDITSVGNSFQFNGSLPAYKEPKNMVAQK